MPPLTISVDCPPGFIIMYARPQILEFCKSHMNSDASVQTDVTNQMCIRFRTTSSLNRKQCLTKSLLSKKKSLI